MGKEMEFFIFLIESYAEYKKTTADKVLKLWDKLELTDFIYTMYDRYHKGSDMDEKGDPLLWRICRRAASAPAKCDRAGYAAAERAGAAYFKVCEKRAG